MFWEYTSSIFGNTPPPSLGILFLRYIFEYYYSSFYRLRRSHLQTFSTPIFEYYYSSFYRLRRSRLQTFSTPIFEYYYSSFYRLRRSHLQTFSTPIFEYYYSSFYRLRRSHLQTFSTPSQHLDISFKMADLARLKAKRSAARGRVTKVQKASDKLLLDDPRELNERELTIKHQALSASIASKKSTHDSSVLPPQYVQA